MKIMDLNHLRHLRLLAHELYSGRALWQIHVRFRDAGSFVLADSRS